MWCPGCRLNLRGLQKITALIKKANEPDSQVGDNVKEPPLDRAARRAIGLASAGERWSRTVSAARQRQMLDGDHLDMLLFNDGQIADWILDQVKLRSLGHRLHRDGGMDLMASVAQRVGALDHGMLRFVEAVWAGIGDGNGSFGGTPIEASLDGQPVATTPGGALIDELITIGRGRGFVRPAPFQADKRTVEIGRALNEEGGMALMRRAHDAVRQSLGGVARELDVAWDGIGMWLG
ncbi:hypothetical protein ACFVRD_45070 [Streptomyces sp. NPDC057908]|uniref:hypothetical protein n=1 Tax=Streptomyces sp. NPDC057908 TaxID=3346276 RepID=UPI0036E8D008